MDKLTPEQEAAAEWPGMYDVPDEDDLEGASDETWWESWSPDDDC